MERIHLVECPRDAIQGWPYEISTEDKIGYLKTLYNVGFDTLDMGSFVSPKAIPSRSDTSELIELLEKENIKQKKWQTSSALPCTSIRFTPFRLDTAGGRRARAGSVV